MSTTTFAAPFRRGPLILPVLALAIAVGCGADATSASTTTVPSSAALERTVRAAVDDWVADGDGAAAVAIADGGGPLVTVTAGATDEGAEFRIGSLTKTFVAVMVLQALDEHDVSLDDQVADHVAGITDGITIRHLLGHRSGLPEHTDGELAPAVLADPGRTWTAADVLALTAGQPLDFTPGERFSYSNTNYVAAGLLLEALTGQSVAENLRSRLVEPLGLTGTYFPPHPDRRPVAGFSPSLPGGSSEAAPYVALETAAGAAGGLVSTAGDVATFVQALGDGELLALERYRDMVEGLAGPDGAGLAVFAADPPSPTAIANSGAIPGFVSYLQYDPAQGDLVVLLVSDDGRPVESLGNALLGALAVS